MDKQDDKSTSYKEFFIGTSNSVTAEDNWAEKKWVFINSKLNPTTQT